MSKKDDRFSYDKNDKIDGVIIYLPESYLKITSKNFAIFDNLREVLADRVDDYFAELEECE